MTRSARGDAMIEYAIDPHLRLMTACISGHAPTAELMDLLERLSIDDAIVGLDRLFVCSDESFDQISTDDVKRIAERGIELWGKGDFRTAIVAERDIEFGIARMLAARRQRPADKINVFRSINEAMAWLGDREAPI